MYNHNKAQQSKNREQISWDILYTVGERTVALKIIACRSITQTSTGQWKNIDNVAD